MVEVTFAVETCLIVNDDNELATKEFQDLLVASTTNTADDRIAFWIIFRWAGAHLVLDHHLHRLGRVIVAPDLVVFFIAALELLPVSGYLGVRCFSQWEHVLVSSIKAELFPRAFVCFKYAPFVRSEVITVAPAVCPDLQLTVFGVIDAFGVAIVGGQRRSKVEIVFLLAKNEVTGEPLSKGVAHDLHV